MWLRVDAGLPTHRKTRRLVRALGLAEGQLTNPFRLRRETVAVAMLVRLWQEVRVNAPDGNLAGWSPADIVYAMGLEPVADGEAERIVAALVECRWLERVGQSYAVTNWSERNGEHLKRAERMREKRATARGVEVDSPVAVPVTVIVPSNVTRTLPSPVVNVHVTEPQETPPTSLNNNGLGRLEHRQASPEPARRADGVVPVSAPILGLMTRLAGTSPPSGVDTGPAADPVPGLVEALPEPMRRRGAQMAHALLKRGVRESIIRLALDDWREHPARNPFAYYRPGTDWFANIHARLSEQEGEEHKRLEAAFLEER